MRSDNQTKLLVLGLVLVAVVSLGLSAYLSVSKERTLLTGFDSRILVASEFPSLETKWNKSAAENQLRMLGIFSKKEIVLLGAQYAPPTVPKESLRHKVERLAVTVGKDMAKGVILPENLAEINVWPSARLDDGGKTLNITLKIDEERVFSPSMTDESLTQAINAVLMAYLEQIVNEKDYGEQLVYYKNQYRLTQLEPILVVERK